MTLPSRPVRLLGQLPEHADEPLWSRYRLLGRSRRDAADMLSLYSAAPILDLLKTSRLSKAGLLAAVQLAARDHPCVTEFLQWAPSLNDGARHSFLRGRIDSLWANGGRARIDDECEQIVLRALLRADPPASIARDVANLFVGWAEWPEQTPILPPSLTSNLNALGAGMSCDFDALELALVSLRETHAECELRPGSLRETLVMDDEVGAFGALALAVFVAAAAMETLHSFLGACHLASHASPSVSAGDVLRWASPVPMVPYSLDDDTTALLWLGSAVRDVTGTNNLAFGHGRHYCFGARLSMRLGDQVVRGAQPREMSDVRWRHSGQVRELSYRMEPVRQSPDLR